MFKQLSQRSQSALLVAAFVLVLAVSSAAQTKVTDAFLKADDANPTGACPVTVVFHGYITMNGAGTVQYTFTRSDGANAPVNTLVFKAAGTQRVSTTWRLGDIRVLPHYEGWQAIKVLSPNPLEANHNTGSFRLTCGKPQAGGGQTPGQTGQGGGASSSGGPNRARFRVTLNGFHVTHQTVDDALERDGAGDEAFLRENSFKIDSAGAVATLSREGTGSRGSTVSVHTSDSVPRGSPADGSLRLFYEGEIARGEAAVVLFPVVWEWDGDAEPQSLGDKFAEMATDPRLARYVSRFIVAPPGARLEDYIKRGSEIGLPLNVTLGHGPLGLGEVGNRPVGMTRSGDRYVFDPQVLILTYDAADMISRTDFGHGLGIFEMRFVDDPDLQGDYTLFLQVKRLP